LSKAALVTSPVLVMRFANFLLIEDMPFPFYLFIIS
jgi:hypothetical protein